MPSRIQSSRIPQAASLQNLLPAKVHLSAGRNDHVYLIYVESGKSEKIWAYLGVFSPHK